MKLLPAIVILCIVLFVVALVSPRKSRKMEKEVDRHAARAAAKARKRDNKVAQLTARSFDKTRSVAHGSAKAGRAGHDKIKRAARRK